MGHPVQRRTHRPSRSHPLRRPRRRARSRQSGPRPRRRARLAARDVPAKEQRHAHRPVRKRRPVHAARARGRCAAASTSCACRGEAPTKAPSSARIGECTPADSLRKWPSSATVSAASAWPCGLIGAIIRGQVHALTRIARRDEAVHVADTTAHMHAWRRSSRARVHSTKSWASKAHAPTPTSTCSPRACPPTSPSTGAADAHPRPTQCRPVLRVRDPPVRMRRRAPRRRARTVPQHRARAHRQTPQPGAGPHGTVPPTPGRPNRHGTPAHAPTPARTRRHRGRGRGVWLGSDGKKILVDAYEAACQRSVTGALPGFSGSWRRHIAHSAQMLARAIAEPDYQWSGVAWR